MESRTVEARKWLNERNENSIGNDEWCDSSASIVNYLYKEGATGVEVEVDGDAVRARTLRVTLPEDEKAARSILMYLGVLNLDDMYEKDGVCVARW